MLRITIIAALVLVASPATAELQNVTIGGEIRIRPRLWHNVYSNGIGGPREIRLAPELLVGRPIGPFGVASRYRFDESGEDLDFIEQRTRLNISADFTNDVRAFVEFEYYNQWGTDFRSNYITGADIPRTNTGDVQVFQSYIEANKMFGHPLRARIGRQELHLGNGWLVHKITTAIIGRSYDMIRFTYTPGDWEVDAWASKLAENSANEQDEDIDFYGVYATYKGFEHVALSAYWMLIRDGRSINDTNFIAPVEWLEDAFGIDNYDPTTMHTVGLRAWGDYGQFDYDLELAYQFGEADGVGALFKPFGVYGDDGAGYDNLAMDLELGYSLDIKYSPRIYIGGAYFEGEDNRDVTFLNWLSPFDKPEASVSFNRLFPAVPHSLIMEIGQDMSNFWQLRAGVTFKPTDAVSIGARLAYFEVDEPFDLPANFSLLGYRVPIAPALSFWTEEADEHIGWTTLLTARYQYSPNLSFGLAWEHLFPGEGLEDGSFMHRYGLEFSGGTADADADYIHADIHITF